MGSNGWEGTTSPKTYFYQDLWFSNVCFTTSVLRGPFSVNNGTYSMCNEVGKVLKGWTADFGRCAVIRLKSANLG
jgi:hypothetical protein